MNAFFLKDGQVPMVEKDGGEVVPVVLPFRFVPLGVRSGFALLLVDGSTVWPGFRPNMSDHQRAMLAAKVDRKFRVTQVVGLVPGSGLLLVQARNLGSRQLEIAASGLIAKKHPGRMDMRGLRYEWKGKTLTKHVPFILADKPAARQLQDLEELYQRGKIWAAHWPSLNSPDQEF